jgi:hypothetical protein
MVRSGKVLAVGGPEAEVEVSRWSGAGSMTGLWHWGGADADELPEWSGASEAVCVTPALWLIFLGWPNDNHDTLLEHGHMPWFPIVE